MSGKVFKQKTIWIPFIFALTLFQFGCVSKTYWTWEHNELSKSQLVLDRQECRQLARNEADGRDFFYNYRNDPFYWPYHSRKHFYDPIGIGIAITVLSVIRIILSAISRFA